MEAAGVGRRNAAWPQCLTKPSVDRSSLRFPLWSEPIQYARPVSEMESTEAELARLEQLREAARHAGSEKAVERQRSEGKLLARERAEKLLDPGSFVELDRYVRHREAEFGMRERRPYGDAVVTGYGTIFGRRVCVFSQDFTVFGGASRRSSPRRSAR